MTVNSVVLSGKICKVPTKKVSPSGFMHYQFVIEHSSERIEATLSRKVSCRMPIVISGKPQSDIIVKIQSITEGCNITVSGFINNHVAKNGINRVVLHAEQIELINSGE